MKPNDARYSKYRMSKLADHEDRIKALETIIIDQGFNRPRTKHGAAIAFVIENMEALHEIIAKHNPATSITIAAGDKEARSEGFMQSASENDAKTHQMWECCTSRTRRCYLSSAGGCCPGKLRSLWDIMEEFKAGQLIDLQSFMTMFAAQAANSQKQERFAVKDDQFEMVRNKIISFQTILTELNLGVCAHWAGEVVRFMGDFKPEDNGWTAIRGNSLLHLIEALRQITQNVGVEVGTKFFIAIPQNKTVYYRPTQPIFAAEVVNKFPNNVSDMFEAGNCFALGRNTACVFHLMRLMEAGVQAFGNKLGVQLANELNWQEILNRLGRSMNRVKLAIQAA